MQRHLGPGAAWTGSFPMVKPSFRMSMRQCAAGGGALALQRASVARIRVGGADSRAVVANSIDRTDAVGGDRAERSFHASGWARAQRLNLVDGFIVHGRQMGANRNRNA